MRPLRCILDDNGNVVPADDMDIREWSRRVFGEQRHVAQTHLSTDIRVSTVFLGINHGFFGDGPPIIFETMVFGGPLDGEQQRYTTLREAHDGHDAMVASVKAKTEAGCD